MNALQRIEALLHARYGLTVETLGHNSLARSVDERCRAIAQPDAESYWLALQRNPGEQQELIETLVVSETWFFREPEAFAALSRAGLLERSARRPLRLLSLPCATGEEACSLAVALLDAGLPPSRFAIDGVDLSAAALERARRAEYGRNAFRGGELGFRARHFESLGDDRFRPTAAVRASLRWQQGNLLAPDLMPAGAPYDVVFCRNLLIYFDRATQEQALNALRRLLAEDGLLFVGPAEAGLLLLRPEFQSLRLPLSFGFRLRAGAAPSPLPPPPPPVPRRRTARMAVPAPHRAVPAAPPRPPEVDALVAAEQLADAGRLEEAERSCEGYLRAHPDSAQALHLLGLLSDARGAAERAADCYRRALYLDPAMEEALIHWACLRQKQGDGEGASQLRRRAEQLQAGKAGLQ